MDDQRIISPQKCSFDENDSDRNLRPPSLNEFTGQDDIKESLSIAIEAAKHRGCPRVKSSSYPSQSRFSHNMWQEVEKCTMAGKENKYFL